MKAQILVRGDYSKRKHARTHATQARTHTHTHTHTDHPRLIQADRSEGQCCLAKTFGEEKCLGFAFEGRESSLKSWGNRSRSGDRSVKTCESHEFCG